ncbi:MAG: hypothetical protein ABL986_07925 [Vicinamibacterales bacterium]
MSLSSLHDYFETETPEGGGFAIHSSAMRTTIAALFGALAVPAPSNTNIAMDQASRVRFSFLFDASTFRLSGTFECSVNVRVWLHPAGQSHAAIVTAEYQIQNARIEPIFDTAVKEFKWTTRSVGSVVLASETWSPTDAALVAAGYALPDGSGDRQRFLDEIYYGFKWLNARNLLPSVLTNIPFPQVQNWFLPFSLQFPFTTSVFDDYLVVWTNEVRAVFHDCGNINDGSTAPVSQWQLRPGSPNPESPYDAQTPGFAMYLGAQNLVSWQALRLAPAVMLSDSGGGFLRWSYDVAVSVRSFMLDLIPGQGGGRLELNSGLRAVGQATAWVDGPSGSRLSLATAALTADGQVRVTAEVEFEAKTRQLVLETTVRAAIDRNSVDLTGGGLVWPLTAVGAEIAEILFKSGAIQVDTSYYSRTVMPLFDLTRASLMQQTRPVHRVGRRSLLTSFVTQNG